MAGEETLTWEDKVLLFLAVLLIVFLILLILLLFCRQRLAKWFPCLVFKIKPEEKTGWRHLDRFGEVKLKSASYSLPEIRARRQVVDDSVEEGSVHTNISLQVPVFEEKLNGTVTKKSVHVASTELDPSELQSPKKKKKKKKSAHNAGDPADDLELQDQGSPTRNKEAVGSAPMPLIPTTRPQPQPGWPRRSPGTGNPQGAVNVKSPRGNPPKETLHCC